MLLGLRHPTLIGGDHEQRGIGPADPGKHVLDEPFVTGDVDETHVDSSEIGPGEAEVDGESTTSFFFPSIRVATGEGRTSVDFP